MDFSPLMPNCVPVTPGSTPPVGDELTEKCDAAVATPRLDWLQVCLQLGTETRAEVATVS